MTKLEISLLVVLAIISFSFIGYLYYNYKNKRKANDDLFIIIDPDSKGDIERLADARKVKVPSGKKYSANIYPEDTIVVKDKGVILINSKGPRIVQKTNPKDELTFTIKKGTQQPLTRV